VATGSPARRGRYDRMMTRRRYRTAGLVAALAGTALLMAPPARMPVVATLGAQTPASVDVDPLHAPFDALLDLYVRDGLVYYRALKSDRAKLDRYVASLDVPSEAYAGWPRARQIAFWINAYNALVIETVIDHYPIRGRASEYPAASVRQIPGVFDRQQRRAAGRRLTLDEIERTVLAAFADPRVFLALGRGSVGGGRLVSEAYTSERLDTQLAEIAAECVTRQECARLDTAARTLAVSPIFSWRQAEFASALGQAEVSGYPGRSPIERAILTLLAPHFLPGEREALRRNDFSISFSTYDWRLNDLTGGPPTR
jgi:Protein of unknown function, DUF547